MNASKRLTAAFLAMLAIGAVCAQEPQPFDPVAYQALKDAEDTEMQDVLANGPGKRLTLPMFKATKDAPSRCSISAPALALGVLKFEMTGPSDTIAMSGGMSFAPAVYGNNSIHRFVATVAPPSSPAATFIGEGDACERLTFVVLAEHGYVYLRGRGKVTLPDGKTMSLPPAAKRPN